MKRFTPKAFEVFVANYLRRMAQLDGWKKPSFRVLNRELMRREEGAFELDVTVRFRALKLNFLVLVECKHYHAGRKVPRDVVMLLYAKLKTLDAHKGVVFSTSGFQKGAILFAKKHRIGLVDCSPRHAEPVTIIGGEPTEMDDVERSLPPIAPLSFDWVFHWGGQSFCAEHWYAAQVLFRSPDDLEPPPTFWKPIGAQG